MVVLSFDGSLRPPKDACVSTQGLGRMASCGASALVVVDDDDKHHAHQGGHTSCAMSLGGRYLDIVPGITSADVEYEALLFGLQHCQDIFARMSTTPMSNKNEHNDLTYDDTSLHRHTVQVRGDCKAIMDQLNGDAIPRKLRPKHEAAKKLLGRIGGHQAQVSFQHVPRLENQLCDSICAGVMEILQERQESAFQSELASLVLSQSAKFETSDVAQQTSKLTLLLEQYLSGNGSLVRYSLRPKLYQQAIAIAHRLEDGIALYHIGRQLVKEAKLWHGDSMAREYMVPWGISLQARGLQQMGNERQAKRLLHKHRHALDRYDAASTTFRGADTTQRLPVEYESNKALEGAVFGDDACHFSAKHNEALDSSLLLQTWYDEASKQSNEVLQEGYWITN